MVKPDVVTFLSNASSIMFKFYNEQKMKDSKSEILRIINTAAKLIRNDIKSMNISSVIKFPRTYCNEKHGCCSRH